MLFLVGYILAMAKSIDYHNYLIESLKDPDEALGYLNAALEDGDIEGFLEALKNVIEAQEGSMTSFAVKAQKSRPSLYKTLSKGGNPYLKSANDILHTLGFQLSVTKGQAAGL
jgi:probable addiction module antidote protein